MDYNDSNRAFLQAFLARGSLTFENAKPILASIFSAHEGREVSPEDINVEDLNSYISAANTAISPLDLEIRSTFHQQTRDRCYALVNTTSDALTQLATTYTADEIAFVSSKWTLKGTDPSGAPVDLSGQTADVVRRQADGNWLMVIDNPYGV